MESTIDRWIDAARGSDGSCNFGGFFVVECGSKGESKKAEMIITMTMVGSAAGRGRQGRAGSGRVGQGGRGDCR